MCAATVAENASSAARDATYEFNMAPVAVERLLRERPAGWFADYDEMLLRALADAVEEGRRIQGRDPKRWRYGDYLRVAINNPVLHEVPLVGKYFDIGPVPMSGSSTTVKQTSRTLAPSMRMNADLGDWDRSLLNIPIGQSGQILSSHYKDQWDGLLQRAQLPHAVRQSERREHAGIQAGALSGDTDSWMLNWLLIFVPVAIGLEFLMPDSHTLIFLAVVPGDHTAGRLARPCHRGTGAPHRRRRSAAC